MLLTWLRVSIIFFYFFSNPNAFGVRVNQKAGTEEFFEICFQALKSFRHYCGRFPRTDEGLPALVEKPKKLKCKSYSRIIESQKYPKKYLDKVLLNPQDGWQGPVRYASDGRHYRIDGSHGYYLTDKSHLHGLNHWSNPKQPPDEKPELYPNEDPKGECKNLPPPKIEYDCINHCEDGLWKEDCF